MTLDEDSRLGACRQPPLPLSCACAASRLLVPRQQPAASLAQAASTGTRLTATRSQLACCGAAAGSRARARIFQSKVVEDLAKALDIDASRIRILGFYESTPERGDGKGAEARGGSSALGGLSPLMAEYTVGGSAGRWHAVGVSKRAAASGRRGLQVDVLLLDERQALAADPGGVRLEGKAMVRPDLKSTSELAKDLERMAMDSGSAARRFPALARMQSAFVVRTLIPLYQEHSNSTPLPCLSACSFSLVYPKSLAHFAPFNLKYSIVCTSRARARPFAPWSSFAHLAHTHHSTGTPARLSSAWPFRSSRSALPA